MKITTQVQVLQESLMATSGRMLTSVLGWEFNTNEPAWRLSKDETLNVELVLSRTPIQHHTAVRKLFEHYAVTLSAGMTLRVANSLGHFFNVCSGAITTDSLINFRSNYESGVVHIQTLRPFFRRWINFSYSGMSEEVVKMLDSWRLLGGQKGVAITRLDTKEGPLTDFEISAFNDGVVFAYEDGRLSLQDLAICLVMSCTGRRPIQITHLKCKDLVSITTADGTLKYYLHIPRAKQRGTGFRDSFKSVELTRELWEILSSHRAKVINGMESLGFQLTVAQKELLPMFPATKLWLRYDGRSDFIEALPTDRLHARTEMLDGVLKGAVADLGILSDRTDDVLNVFARRFRYTVGTRAAREGVSEYVIAEILDHSDIQHVNVYTLNVPEHLKKINEALGFQLALYVKAFTGNLVDTELDAIRGADPSSRVKHKKCGVGTCGNFSYCGMNVPRPCYTCVNFQPWLDGPHEDLYFELLDERELILARTGDLTIAAVLDRTIVAVAEVIKKCAARKQEIARG